MRVFSSKLTVINESSSDIDGLLAPPFYRKSASVAASDTFVDEIDFDFRRFPFDAFRKRAAGSYERLFRIQIGGSEYHSVPDPDPVLWKHGGAFDLGEGRRLRYSLKVDRIRGRFADVTLRFSDVANGSAWMQNIGDDRLLTQLAIPGTHDSATYLFQFPYVGTQSLDFTSQLNSGVRFLDIRVGKTINNYWHMYHGSVPLGDYDILVDQLSRFLNANPTETVVVSIKEDNTLVPSSKTNLEIFNFYRNRDRQLRWFTENRVPKLGEVRGMAVFLRRFTVADWEKPLGIDASRGWWDNASFSIPIRPTGQTLEVQDRYKTDNPVDKYNWGLEYLWRARNSDYRQLYLNFFSGTGGILGWFPPYPATPEAIAKGYFQWYFNVCRGLQTQYYDGVNDMLAGALGWFWFSRFIFGRTRGIVIMDYPESNDLAPRVVQLND
jgi:1-phosphatidylinositol phosphodiesterase